MAAYREPEVIVKSATVRDGISFVALTFNREPDMPPIAPGAIYRPMDLERPIFEVHKLVSRDGLVMAFETYGSTAPMPQVGSVFAYRSWLTPAGMKAVLDEEAGWRLTRYDAAADHEHCLIMYEAINRSDPAYFSPIHGWIRVEAYERYIQRDVLRIRSRGLRAEDC